MRLFKIEWSNQIISKEEFENLKSCFVIGKKYFKERTANDFWVSKEDAEKVGKTVEELKVEEYNAAFKKQNKSIDTDIMIDYCYGSNECLVNDDFLDVVKELEFKILEVQHTNTKEYDNGDLYGAIQDLIRLDATNEARRLANEKCKVHIGGNKLMEITKVKVEVNCCTDYLQSQLDEGWRIIAVSVQPDGRRPDYVLGK